MKKLKSIGLSALMLLSLFALLYLKNGNMFSKPGADAHSEQAGTDNDYGYKEIGGFIETVNDNKPVFSEDELKADKGYEYYSELDELGRCGSCIALIGSETIPTEPRGEIGSVNPTGWKQAKYPGIVDSDPPYLYNRCHLIAYCLTGENANEKNLITGTRYFNTEGMLPFETIVARYMDRNPDNHVLYKVTPHFEGDELVARYVTMEAYSIEDNGVIRFNAKVNNIQPGIVIDYSTGESKAKQDL